MNFFEQQDLARRNTRVLLLSFLVAVFLLIALTNLAVAAFLWWGEGYNVYSGRSPDAPVFIDYLSWQRFGGIAMGICAVISLVILVRWLTLAAGGKTVAESMGGQRILPQTEDPQEKRCLNIVEEMALAANMPVPPVYVLNDERGINAFAAGTAPANAVVAVTRGTLGHLKRSELQGVIAHEFSHILNGDMRLNIRLAAILKGITFIGDVGYFLMRGSSRSGRRAVRSGGDGKGGGAQLVLLGLVLWLLGWVGGLFAGFIKAAIGRQKEFLADASAVQFTRNPEGIGGALKVIGGYVPGSLVHAARAAELSHFFFGEVVHGLWQVFASHPPLEQRIRRIDPRWDGKFIERKPVHYEPERKADGLDRGGVGRAAIVTAVLAGTALGKPIEVDAEGSSGAAGDTAPDDADFDQDGAAEDELESSAAPQYDLPQPLVKYCHEPLGANAIVFALLVHDAEAVRSRQLQLVADTGVQGLELLLFNLLPEVSALHPSQRLPLLEMCLPALKAMSRSQYRRFKDTMLGLIQADQRTDLYEWCLYQLVRHYLDPEFILAPISRPRYRKLDKVLHHLRVVLSVLAHEGLSGQPAAEVFRVAADELGFTALEIMPREQASVAAFSRAVQELADCYPLLKPRILKAMALAAGYDGHFSAPEREIIAAMAAVMDCPVPDSMLV